MNEFEKLMHTRITAGKKGMKISGAGGVDERERSDFFRDSEAGPAAARSDASVR